MVTTLPMQWESLPCEDTENLEKRTNYILNYFKVFFKGQIMTWTDDSDDDGNEEETDISWVAR